MGLLRNYKIDSNIATKANTPDVVNRWSASALLLLIFWLVRPAAVVKCKFFEDIPLSLEAAIVLEVLCETGVEVTF